MTARAIFVWGNREAARREVWPMSEVGDAAWQNTTLKAISNERSMHQSIMKLYESKDDSPSWFNWFYDFTFYSANSPSIFDLYAWVTMMEYWIKGEVYILDIDMGEEPPMDSDVAGMNAALSSINNKFKSRFWGEKWDCDGLFEWSRDTEFSRFSGEKILLESYSIPLEVGSTKCTTSIVHMRSSGGLARWSYGSKLLKVAVRSAVFKKRISKKGQMKLFDF